MTQTICFGSFAKMPFCLYTFEIKVQFCIYNIKIVNSDYLIFIPTTYYELKVLGSNFCVIYDSCGIMKGKKGKYSN